MRNRVAGFQCEKESEKRERKQKRERKGRREEGGLQFHEIQLALLRYDLIDERGEFGVRLDDLASDGTLHGRFNLGFCAGGEAASLDPFPQIGARGRGG